MRATLRIALREQEGERLLPEEVHQEAYHLMEALLRSRKSEEIRDVSTSSDAEFGLVTAEAVVDARDERAGAERFAGIVRKLLAIRDEGRREGARRIRYEISDSEATGI